LINEIYRPASVARVLDFQEQQSNQAGIIIYPDAGHAFENPNQTADDAVDSSKHIVTFCAWKNDGSELEK
jgi:S-methylmethionine-dependent homocysteine/selenocysteine methylase